MGIAGGALAFLAVAHRRRARTPSTCSSNLNPPTVCLVVLGVAQLALFQLARPRIRAWVERADASRRISFVGERAMTVYLWHMPVLIVLAGLSLVANAMVGMPLPEPLTARVVGDPPAVARRRGGGGRARRARVRALRAGASDRDRVRAAPPAASVGATAIDAVCGVAGVAVLLVCGFGPVPAGVSLALLLVALVGSLRIGRAVRTAGVVGIAGIAVVAELARTTPVAHARPRHPLPL